MSVRHAPAAFAGRDHDHAACGDDAIAAAEAICRARDERLTPLRRRVLELVWRSHEPVGAYDLLAALRKDGRSGAPPTVYRALDFLLEQGFVHRIQSLNAFVGCNHPGETHAGQFLICRRCRSAAELHDAEVGKAVSEGAERIGFRVLTQTIEISGFCLACQGAEKKR
jgi:Fur family zinc uptake transcriptional regulator